MNTTNILNTLRAAFGHVPGLDFVDGPGGLPTVQARNDHAEASIALHGAHLLSFKPRAVEHDLLWMSQRSHFEIGHPIRGGIPICWPWFGAHPSDEARPAHGLARISNWTLESAAQEGRGVTQLEFGLHDPATAAALKPLVLEAQVTISIGSALEVALHTVNRGNEPATLTQALHSYFNISDVANIEIQGLEQHAYVDTVGGVGATKPATGRPITLTEETDRVYQDTEDDCRLVDRGWERTILVQRSGSRSAVVWNPWIDKSKRMPDFGDEEYHSMVCIEAANARADARILAPGESHKLTTRIGEEL